MTSRNYQIVRMVFGGRRRIIKTGLTREEAVAHCKDPETSGSTCSDLSNRGRWFDGFEEMPYKKIRRRKLNTNRLGQSLKKCYFG